MFFFVSFNIAIYHHKETLIFICDLSLFPSKKYQLSNYTDGYKNYIIIQIEATMAL